jgi:hypothetical protein
VISEEALAVLAGLHESPAFRMAIREIVEDQRGSWLETMRGHVQSGDFNRAQRAEGALTMFDELPGLLANYVKQYKPTRI